MMFCSLFCICKKENDREINKWYNEEKIGRQIEICVGGRVFMGKIFLFMLYIVFAFILGILSVVLKKKHTQFPDFRVGYHNKKIMENKEKWDYANNVAGNLCALFAVIGIIVSVILYLLKANMNTTIIIFFIYTITAILAILVLTVKLIKK